MDRTQELENTQLKVIDYFGWKVLEEPMYDKFAKIDLTQEDVPEMTEVIEKYVKNKTVALDVGCHYGFFTKFLSEQFKTVHAFDFNNDVFECFEKNMEKFKCKNVIKHPYGLGEKQKYVSTNDWSNRHQRRGPLGNHIDPNGSVRNQKIKPLDRLGIEDIGLIMIDTEGYELNVLRGAVNTIMKYKPVLVVEFYKTKKNKSDNLTGKYGYNLKQLRHYITNLGYRFRGYLNKVDQIFVYN